MTDQPATFPRRLAPWVAIAGILFLAVAAACAEQAPENVLGREWLQRQQRLGALKQFKSVQQQLENGLNAAAGQQIEAALRGPAMDLLAKVYQQSGAYQRALDWLERAEQVPSVDARVAWRIWRERAVLRARALAGLGELERASASLRRALQTALATRPEDTATRVRLQVVLAKLLQRPAGDPQLQALVEHIPALYATLNRNRRENSLRPADHLSAVRDLATLREANGELAEAAALLVEAEALADRSVAREDRERYWRHRAKVARLREAATAEAVALQSALLHLPPEPKQTLPAAVLEGVTIALDRAELEGQLGLALFRADEAAAAGEVIARCQTLLQECERRLASIDGPELAREVGGRRLILREREYHLRRRLLEAPRLGSGSEVLAAGRQLLQAYDAALIASDARIFRLRTALGIYALKEGDYGRARGDLVAALEYWRERRQTHPLELAQTLNALGDVERGRGYLSHAEDLLRDAEKICGDDPQRKDLWLTVQINLGRLAAAQGDYRTAHARLQEVINETEQDQSEFNGQRSLAFLNRGLLHKSMFQFDIALELCEQALTLRKQVLDDSSDPELLVHHIALASLHIARRDVDALDDVLTDAEQIQRKTSGTDKRWNAILRHQRAMVQFLRDERQASPSARAKARMIWRGLLNDDKAPPQPAMEARVRFYISRLAYRDWQLQIEEWLEQQQDAAARAERLAEFQREVEVFEEELEEFKQRLAEFVVEKEDYADALNEDRQRGAANFAQRKNQFQRLESRHTHLQTDRGKLVAERKRLNQLREALSAVPGDTILTTNSQAAGSSQASAEPSLHWLDEAATEAKHSVTILEDLLVYPSLHHLALCHYAETLHAKWAWDPQAERSPGWQVERKDDEIRQQALARLEEALQLLELPRARSLGGALERAEFLDAYTKAYDLLVDWRFESAEFEQALWAAELGRNRSYLEEIRAVSLQREQSAQIRARAQRLLHERAAIERKIEAWHFPTEVDIDGNDESRLVELQRRYRKLTDEYIQARDAAWQEIPARRALLEQGTDLLDVQAAIRGFRDRDEALLYYYVGNQQSYAFWLAGRDGTLAGFRLTESSLPLARSRLQQLVHGYRHAIMPRKTHSLTGSDVETQQPQLAEWTATILPNPIQRALRDAAIQQRSHVMVVPAGRLYDLPLEALVARADGEPSGQEFAYGLDLFPPLAYAPSLMILEGLRGRWQAVERSDPYVVTVGDPDYEHRRSKSEEGSPGLSGKLLAVDDRPVSRPEDPLQTRSAVRQLRLHSTSAELLDIGLPPYLRRLEYSQGESNLFVATFRDQDSAAVVQQLVRGSATEGELRNKLSERSVSYLHIAAHALLDRDHANLFGSIQLAMPKEGQISSKDDGRLEQHEIYDLPLQACELAVLSACHSNLSGTGTGQAQGGSVPEQTSGSDDEVEPILQPREMDAGFSLARAFLGAGAQRVVATQWQVEDQSTAMLIGEFARQLAAQEGPHQTNLARALHVARKQLRATGLADPESRWDEPQYWAPFVIVGPVVP